MLRTVNRGILCPRLLGAEMTDADVTANSNIMGYLPYLPAVDCRAAGTSWHLAWLNLP